MIVEGKCERRKIRKANDKLNGKEDERRVERECVGRRGQRGRRKT